MRRLEWVRCLQVNIKIVSQSINLYFNKEPFERDTPCLPFIMKLIFYLVLSGPAFITPLSRYLMKLISVIRCYWKNTTLCINILCHILREAFVEMKEQTKEKPRIRTIKNIIWILGMSNYEVYHVKKNILEILLISTARSILLQLQNGRLR